MAGEGGVQLTLWDTIGKPILDGLRRLAGRPKPRRKQRIDDAAHETGADGAPAMPGRSKTRRRKAAGDTTMNRTPKRRAHRAPRESASAKYDRIVKEMVARYDVKVRRWRASMSGVAYEIAYRDGTRKRLIESPKPKSPMSMAIFLHEIGHHAIGLGRYKPRCLEEYHAWMFSLRTMEEQGLEVTERVRTRVKRSLEYAVAKAARRGIKEVPAELREYVPARLSRRGGT